MALTTEPSSNNSCVKTLTECSDLRSLPSQFTFANYDPKGSRSDSIPVIDFSLLDSADPEQRSKVLRDLDHACREWGFFAMVNHGIPETLMKAIVDASLEFFELSEEDKWRYETKLAMAPIMSGGSFSVVDAANQRIHMWREFVKSYVHPEFNCPDKPLNLRDILLEYSERTRTVARKLLQAASENLGLEHGYMDEALKLDSCFQQFAANYYPPCPQPDRAIGIPGHTDPSLLTFLIHNGVAGLQIQHECEWFDTGFPPNSILVNTADHLEIFSNGRYKSVTHRAVVNDHTARISVVVANGAAPDAIVGPAPQLVERDGRAVYRPMKFMDYLEMVYGQRRLDKSNLDCVKIKE